MIIGDDDNDDYNDDTQRFHVFQTNNDDYYFNIVGLKLLDGPLTDSMEADAFTKYFQINDIFSCR